MFRAFLRISVVGLVLATSGCGSDGDDHDDGGGSRPGGYGPGSGSPINKVDLLLVIDNSLGMVEKQTLLREAVPELLSALINPPCVDSAGVVVSQPADGLAPCADSAVRQTTPLTDIHVGSVTGSTCHRLVCTTQERRRRGPRGLNETHIPRARRAVPLPKAA